MSLSPPPPALRGSLPSRLDAFPLQISIRRIDYRPPSGLLRSDERTVFYELVSSDCLDEWNNEECIWVIRGR